MTTLARSRAFAHSIGYFTPVLTADRLGGDDHGAVAAVRLVVNMRDAAVLAVMHTLALDVLT